MARPPGDETSCDDGPLAEAGGVSRREFLLTSTAAALTGELAVAPVAAAAGAPAAALRLGPKEIPVTLNVNGATRRLKVSPETTLAAALREGLDLTGTKVGCDRGACGACTVWVGSAEQSGAPFSGGRPQPACLTLALDVAGFADVPARPVTTIEGLAKGDALHPVQEAFIAEDALQCGFCTPGMIMSCAALYEKHRGAPPPSDAQIREAIAGNLCRCAAYPGILRATRRACGAQKDGGR